MNADMAAMNSMGNLNGSMSQQ